LTLTPAQTLQPQNITVNLTHVSVQQPIKPSLSSTMASSNLTSTPKSTQIATGATVFPLTNGIYFLGPEDYVQFLDHERVECQLEGKRSKELLYEVQGTAIQLRNVQQNTNQFSNQNLMWMIDPSGYSLNVAGKQFSFLASQNPQNDRIYWVSQQQHSSAIKQLMIFNQGQSFVVIDSSTSEMAVGTLNTTKTQGGVLVSQGTLSIASKNNNQKSSFLLSAVNLKFFGIVLLIDKVIPSETSYRNYDDRVSIATIN